MKNSLRIPLIAMIAAIVVIVSFQGWWLWQTYKDQRRELHFRTNSMFRESTRQLLGSKMDLDTTVQLPFSGKDQVLIMMNRMRRKLKDSAQPKDLNEKTALIIRTEPNGKSPKFQKQVEEMLMRIDSARPPLNLNEIQARYAQQLKKQNIDIDFLIIKDSVTKTEDNSQPAFDRNEITIGIKRPITYRLELLNETRFLLGKLGPQIIFSVFLVGLTILSFSILYKSLSKQQKLTELKNDFINNITHELKTPIATVSVAIEALKNFNAMHDPVRTQEYLDISGNELNRLSMLVDKVLKMSMFEKRELELKKEPIALDNLIKEVVRSMQLQFEKVHAQVDIKTNGNDFTTNADKLHITNLVYNLLDNALKYGRDENPVIDISIAEKDNELTLQVSDNGIGISNAYKDKIFDKFFRVPHGNTHNIKGYGLGLSYVAQVVREHGGKINVMSEEGKGSTFKVCLPKR